MAPENTVQFVKRKLGIFGLRFSAPFRGNSGQIRRCQERISVLVFTGGGVEEVFDVGEMNLGLIGLEVSVSTYIGVDSMRTRVERMRGYMRIRVASCSIAVSLCKSTSFKSKVSVS